LTNWRKSFGETDGVETQLFLSELQAALQAPGGSLMAIGTMRSDFLSEFQKHPKLSRLPYEAVHIGPMSVENFAEVIEGPANVAGLRLGPGLTTPWLRTRRTRTPCPCWHFPYASFSIDTAVMVY
jgi:hypothetical protein